MKAFYSCLLFCLPLYIWAQPSDTLDSKYLSIGTKHAGICFGNSYMYSGIRLNLYDHDVGRITGINVCAAHYGSSIINGVSVALVDVKTEDTLRSARNGICIGLIGEIQNKINGIGLGLWCGADRVNGVIIGGWALGHRINGAAGGLIVGGDTLDGLFAGFGIMVLDTNGQFNGVAVSLGNSLTKAKGLMIAIFNKCIVQKGLSIGVFNSASHLHGIQIGLLNHAANNPKWYRWLPLLNMHFKKD